MTNTLKNIQLEPMVGSVAITKHGGGQFVFLCLRERFPQHVLGCGQRDGKRTEFYQNLAGTAVTVTDVRRAFRVDEIQ